jgi:hypothetical protein
MLMPICSVQALRRLKQIFLVPFAIVLSLGGCAHTWAPGPETGLSLSQLEPAKARCSLMARHSGSSFEAYGNVRFVAAATLGNAIGDTIRSHEDFDDCMVAGGWQIASKQNVSHQDNRNEPSITSNAFEDRPGESSHPEYIKEILSVSNDCIRTMRNNTDYIPIQQYLGDSDTGKHTMVQQSVTRFATLSEAKAYASMLDQAHGCTDIAIKRVTRLSPAFASLLARYREDSDTRALAVLRQQQTWGEYASQEDHAIDALEMHMKGDSL